MNINEEWDICVKFTFYIIWSGKIAQLASSLGNNVWFFITLIHVDFFEPRVLNILKFLNKMALNLKSK